MKWPAPEAKRDVVEESAAWLAQQMTVDPEVKIAVRGFMERTQANTLAGAMQSHPLELVELCEAMKLMCEESPLEETIATSAETVIWKDT